VSRGAKPEEFEAAARDFQKKVEDVNQEKLTVDQTQPDQAGPQSVAQ